MFYLHEDCEVLTDLSIFFSGGGDVGDSDFSLACTYSDVDRHVSLFLTIVRLLKIVRYTNISLDFQHIRYFICQKVSEEG